MPCPTVVYHAIGGAPQGGAHMVMPAFPRSWQRAFNIYDSSWSADSGGEYVIDYPAFTKYLDWTEDQNRDTAKQWHTHSAGSCEATFDGPIVLDMERYRPREKPAVFRDILDRVQAWRPRAKLMLYGAVSKWASQWDTPSTAAAKMSENDADNTAVFTLHKHVALYLKDASAAATWEAWNNKNVAEVVRWAAKTGGRAYAMVTLSDHDGTPMTDAARMLAQVRPAIRAGIDIQVWDYFTSNAARDARVASITALQTAISTAKADLWGE